MVLSFSQKVKGSPKDKPKSGLSRFRNKFKFAKIKRIFYGSGKNNKNNNNGNTSGERGGHRRDRSDSYPEMTGMVYGKSCCLFFLSDRFTP